MALFLIGWLVLWVPLILKAFVPVEVDYFAILFGSSMIALGYFLFFGPLFSVNDWRVAALPFLFQPSNEHEPLLLREFRPPWRHGVKPTDRLGEVHGGLPRVRGSGCCRIWRITFLGAVARALSIQPKRACLQLRPCDPRGTSID